MVLPASHRIPRVLRYSGAGCPLVLFVYGAVTLFGCAFHRSSTKDLSDLMPVHNPTEHAPWFGLFPVRSPLLRKSLFIFSSSGYLDVSVPRVPSSQTMDSSAGVQALPWTGSPIRISTDRYLLAVPRGFSQLAASFFGGWRLGIHPVLLFA